MGCRDLTKAEKEALKNMKCGDVHPPKIYIPTMAEIEDMLNGLSNLNTVMYNDGVTINISHEEIKPKQLSPNNNEEGNIK